LASSCNSESSSSFLWGPPQPTQASDFPRPHLGGLKPREMWVGVLPRRRPGGCVVPTRGDPAGQCGLLPKHCR
ncbi:unnamed protein product, partial [Gulo gulo]